MLLYIVQYSNNINLNPILHISQGRSDRKAFGHLSKGYWFEPTVRQYFSSNNVRLLACVFLGEDLQSE